MGCACGRRAAQNASARAAGVTYVYDYTPPGVQPGPTTTVPYGTALEGKTAVRRNGGGTLLRRAVNAAAPA